jgi:hypothetical protein
MGHIRIQYHIVFISALHIYLMCRLLTIHMELELKDLVDFSNSYTMDFNEDDNDLLQVQRHDIYYCHISRKH